MSRSSIALAVSLSLLFVQGRCLSDEIPPASRKYHVKVFRIIDGTEVEQPDRNYRTNDLPKAFDYFLQVKRVDGWTATSNVIDALSGKWTNEYFDVLGNGKRKEQVLELRRDSTATLGQPGGGDTPIEAKWVMRAGVLGLVSPSDDPARCSFLIMFRFTEKDGSLILTRIESEKDETGRDFVKRTDKAPSQTAPPLPSAPATLSRSNQLSSDRPAFPKEFKGTFKWKDTGDSGSIALSVDKVAKSTDGESLLFTGTHEYHFLGNTYRMKVQGTIDTATSMITITESEPDAFNAVVDGSFKGRISADSQIRAEWTSRKDNRKGELFLDASR